MYISGGPGCYNNPKTSLSAKVYAYLHRNSARTFISNVSGFVGFST